MADNRISTVSKNYANALIQIAEDSNSYELIKIQLLEIQKVFVSSADLSVVMANTSISSANKIDILESVFANKIDVKLLNFLKLLVEKNRFGEFDSIVASYIEMLDKMSNKKKVEITSSIDLTFENKTNVLFALEHKLNCEVVPIWRVDKSIIAGLTFKFDDYVIDTSVRTKIENLRKKITR